MTSRVFLFELDGQEVLGFDTGLNAQAFAQAKMAQFITQNGFLVFPDGKVELWKARGVHEINGTMVIWGPVFPGESLDALLKNSARKDDALDATRFWLKARTALGKESAVYPGAAGAFIITREDLGPGCPRGTVLFPPERLVKRSLEARGDEAVINAQQWFHPDLGGDEAVTFTAAAMVYAVLSGNPPFSPRGYSSLDEDTLRQDIREGVFVPPRLAAPGLDSGLAEILTLTLGSPKQRSDGKKRPAPEVLRDFLENKNAASWFSPLEAGEAEKIKTELDQYKKTRNLTIKTKRFVVRNTTIIAICAAVLVAGALIIRGHLKHLAELPTTLGMTPPEVARAYYGAFETLDHQLMEACVTGRDAKLDIDMILNLYVITRARMAYESRANATIPAREWIAAGSPATEDTVFGVTDLEIKTLGGDEAGGEILLEAAYTLWMPPSYAGDEDVPGDEEILEGTYVNPPPRGYRYRDELRLVWVKDSWRVAGINRSSLQN